MSWLASPIACDVCGAVKQPSNHWYFGEIQPNAPGYPGATFTIWPWNQRAELRSMPYVHLCGQACVARKLNEWFSAPPPPSDLKPCSQGVIQQQENEKPAQPQWTEDGLITQKDS